jgi:hypothetical protein
MNEFGVSLMKYKAMNSWSLAAGASFAGLAQAHVGQHDGVGLAGGLVHLLLEHGPLLLIAALALALPLLRSGKAVKGRGRTRED